MAASTITEISDSSNLVWEIVCRHEDGQHCTTAEYAQLSDADRQILSEEIERIERKWDRAAAHAEVDAEHARGCSPALSFVPTLLQQLDARDEHRRNSGHCFEGAILARQEFEVYGNC